MKKFIVILLSNFIFTISFAQTDAAYRIFGEIMTVENKVYKGFITWNGNKNYWIDFFEASKIENPYRSYFKRSDGLVFRANDREFITPPTHNFCCRFGNIKSIRPTDVNEIVLQLKNGDRLTLVKGYSSPRTRKMLQKKYVPRPQGIPPCSEQNRPHTRSRCPCCRAGLCRSS